MVDLKSCAHKYGDDYFTQSEEFTKYLTIWLSEFCEVKSARGFLYTCIDFPLQDSFHLVQFMPEVFNLSFRNRWKMKTASSSQNVVGFMTFIISQFGMENHLLTSLSIIKDKIINICAKSVLVLMNIPTYWRQYTMFIQPFVQHFLSFEHRFCFYTALCSSMHYCFPELELHLNQGLEIGEHLAIKKFSQCD